MKTNKKLIENFKNQKLDLTAKDIIGGTIVTDHLLRTSKDGASRELFIHDDDSGMYFEYGVMYEDSAV